jgi:hypothetical protein
MRSPRSDPADEDVVRVFVEELVGTGLMLADLLPGLLDALKEDAYPGEDSAAVLLEMVTGTIRPVADAAGQRRVQDATALVSAAADKTLADLRTALDLARQRQQIDT